MRASEAIIFGIIILSFILGVYLYPVMPDAMATHWDAEGQVNGHMAKFWGLFLMPLISIGLLLLFVAIPRIDPLKENIAKFRSYFDGFVMLVIIFLFYIHLLTLFWNTGATFNMVVAIVPALSVLFYYSGSLISHAKQNWFIGIRTPWTLSSEAVWDKTHALGAKLFKGAAVISLVGLFFPRYAIWFVLVPIIFATGYSVVYSYTEWKKEKKETGL